MARMRMLKPGFFTNDVLATVPPLGRLLFAGLWGIADREGRLYDRPPRIKVEVLPYDKVNVDRLLSELAEHGFIKRYEVGGERYIAIENFTKHQTPHVKEPASTIPAPTQSGALPVPDRSLTETVTESVTDTETVRASLDALTPEQVILLGHLHGLVRTRLYAGRNAPDSVWCEDLIRRGATESDIEYAVEQSANRALTGSGILNYPRRVLETRVKEREQGNDPDVQRGTGSGGSRGDGVSGTTQRGGLRFVGQGRNASPRVAGFDGSGLPRAIGESDDDDSEAAGGGGSTAPPVPLRSL